MTRNNDAALNFQRCVRNECVVNDLSSNNWRKSLVPAPAVIPAPVVYTKVAAVKKLVVGFLTKLLAGPPRQWCVPAWRLSSVRMICVLPFTGLVLHVFDLLL